MKEIWISNICGLRKRVEEPSPLGGYKKQKTCLLKKNAYFCINFQ